MKARVTLKKWPGAGIMHTIFMHEHENNTQMLKIPLCNLPKTIPKQPHCSICF